jgi:hypothetical protein
MSEYWRKWKGYGAERASSVGCCGEAVRRLRGQSGSWGKERSRGFGRAGGEGEIEKEQDGGGRQEANGGRRRMEEDGGAACGG